jgi:hypothetical protein
MNMRVEKKAITAPRLWLSYSHTSIIQPLWARSRTVPLSGEAMHVPGLSSHAPLCLCGLVRFLLLAVAIPRMVRITQFVSDTSNLVRLPVIRQPPVVVRIRDFEFDGVQAHGDGEVDPSPGVASNVSALISPPLASHGTPVGTVPTGKMLHQQTGVDCDDNAGTEPGKEAQDLGRLVFIVETWLL